MPRERIVFHIDMNSYFASVAQQANPFLRGKPIGVGGKPGTRGIIAAPSIEAKRRGVKTAMNAYEALRACPDLEIVHGDPDAYEDVTNRFLRIFRRYTDAVEVSSIDEAFLDVTGWHERYGGPEALAGRIKADMRAELGERITCSVGIAPNRVLAKLASDLKKPDGIVRILPEDVPVLYAFTPVTEICGIAERMRRRLARIGVRTLTDLSATPLTRLTVAFGPVMGANLWLLGKGEDLSPVADAESAAKSFGNSYTLPHDETSPRIVSGTLLKLAEKAARRMRAEGFRCRRVGAFVRYGDMSGAGDGVRLGEPTDDPVPIFDAAWGCLVPLLPFRPANERHPGPACRQAGSDPGSSPESWIPAGVYPGLDPRLRGDDRSGTGMTGKPAGSPHAVRMLGVQLTELSREDGQLALWPEGERLHRLIHAMDAITDRYGPQAMHAAATVGVALKRHVSGFKHGTTLERKRIR